MTDGFAYWSETLRMEKTMFQVVLGAPVPCVVAYLSVTRVARSLEPRTWVTS
jgi:hypothetical protein